MIKLMLASLLFLLAAASEAQVQDANTGLRLSTTQRVLLDKYCVTCHNARLRTAGLMLDTAELKDVSGSAEIWEKVVRKLRADAMPPPGLPRPEKSAQAALVSWLETKLDGEAAANPNPGRSVIHRLNRTEYVNAIRDLFDLHVDARSLLPGDNSDVHGFDNDAETLSISPALMERYVAAARKISEIVIGRPATPDLEQYRIPKLMVQDDRMSDDLPFGSRGGIAIPYYFPADGDYVIKLELHRTGNDYIMGLGAAHQLDIRLDGGLLKRFTVGGDEWVKLAPPENYSANLKMDPRWEDYEHNADRDLQVRLHVRAGQRTVGVSFVQQRWWPEGVIQRQVGISLDRNELPDGNPRVASVTISGPFGPAGSVASPTARRILVCHATHKTGEDACAKKVLSTIARRAYRRPVSDMDLQPLLKFYEAGRKEGDFDAGIEFALERLLCSPAFLFRLEQDPAPGRAARITDIELASRLSFFLWSSIPDDQLLDLAEHGKLRDPTVLEQQVRRMLTDSRSKALVDNFAGQWLVTRNVRDVVPDSDLFPDFDDNLRQAFERETELFMNSQIREDHSILDLINANYTFVNERLARHYNIPNVYGNEFRRVRFNNDERGGLLGQGSILMVTSYPNRTSPVLRGKWLLENFFGTPPPPPPPGVPPLKENDGNTHPTSVRARLEEHRKSPACASCHSRMDPLGFALENYDAVGVWRTSDETRTPINASATLPDGTQFVGPSGLRKLLLSRHDQFVQTVTEKLLTYALGRELQYFDAPAVRYITRAAAANNYRWSSLILEIVKSVPFQMRRSVS